MVGIDRLHKWATALGLGGKSGIDLPNEVEGIMPSTEWKREQTGEKWYAGETISVSIGQGQVSVTPISLAVMMSTVANGGTRVKPRLVKAVDDGTGWKPVPAPQPPGRADSARDVSALHDGPMAGRQRRRARAAAGAFEGATSRARPAPRRSSRSRAGRQAAGRTDKDLRDHGWFVFFAPRDNPEIAGVVFARAFRARLSRRRRSRKHVIATYFAKKEGRPLPPWPQPAVAVAAERYARLRR